MERKKNTILQTYGIGKEFGGVWVLENIDFDLKAGEIHSLVGENGAGKSTFIKILSGVHFPSSGHIEVLGKKMFFNNVKESEHTGIRTVHQEINLVSFFRVYENMFIGDEIEKGIFGFRYTDDREMKRRAGEVLRKLGVEMKASEYTHNLDASLQRIVQIGKVLIQKPKVLVFDEPTTSLGEEERKRLLEIIKGMKGSDIGIIYITHNLDEVMEISDRITVFRDGKNVGTMNIDEASSGKIVTMMIGHKMYKAFSREEEKESGEVCLELKDVFTEKLQSINLQVRKKEILGIAGVVGAGKTEIGRAIFGIDRLKSGSIIYRGDGYHPAPQTSLQAGIALVPEERQAEGLIPNYSVAKNITLSNLDRFSKVSVLDRGKEKETAEKYIDLMSIKTTGPNQMVKFLSGGNQQKVVLSRLLNNDFEVGIFDEPTKGIDVRAKEDIYKLIAQLAQEGKAILFLSSYLPELLNTCDRIIVIRNGKIVGEYFPGEPNTKEKIMHAMLGGNAPDEKDR